MTQQWQRYTAVQQLVFYTKSQRWLVTWYEIQQSSIPQVCCSRLRGGRKGARSRFSFHFQSPLLPPFVPPRRINSIMRKIHFFSPSHHHLCGTTEAVVCSAGRAEQGSAPYSSKKKKKVAQRNTKNYSKPLEPLEPQQAAQWHNI